MNIRRLLLSLAILVFAGSVVAGGTGAFFSDEERSEGNLFTSGSIDLKVDSEAHYNGMVCTEVDEDVFEWEPEDGFDPGPDHYPALGDECGGTWELRDLGGQDMPSTKFFDYGDLKPGDHGENTISLHVYDNESYVCAIIDNMEDNDLGLTEPEEEDGDSTDGDGNGELSQYIRFLAWNDDGDNVWEDGEEVLFSNEEGPASDVIDGVSYPLYTPQTGPFEADETEYIGLYWCFGQIDVDYEENTIMCDGGPVDNVPQSDELLADITFYVEQSRNNPEFECPEPREPDLPEADVIETDTWSQVDLDGEVEWFAKARQSKIGDLEYEISVGLDPATVNKDTADTTWISSTVYPFTLSFDGTDATFTVNGETTTYTVGPGTFDRIGLTVAADVEMTTSVDNLSLDVAAPLADDDVTATNGKGSLTISGVDISSGFELTGDMTFSFLSLPDNGEKQKMLISID